VWTELKETQRQYEQASMRKTNPHLWYLKLKRLEKDPKGPQQHPNVYHSLDSYKRQK